MSSLSAEQFEDIKSELAMPKHRTIGQIAKSLGVTKGVVIGKLHRAGIRTGSSSLDVRDRLEAQRQRIVELADMGACAQAIAAELGIHSDTLRRFCIRNGIEIRVHIQSAKNVGARRALAGTFGKAKALHPRDRQEMDRLRDEAIAAGKFTRLPPGHAYGALRWGKSEYA